MILCVGLYMTAALVTPEFTRPEDNDLVRFHQRQRVTYLAANLVLLALTTGLNAGAAAEGIGKWAQQTAPSLVLAVPLLAALVSGNRVIQIAAPVLATALMLASALLFYPRIG